MRDFNKLIFLILQLKNLLLLENLLILRFLRV